jgi:hypothetical protein
MNTDRTSASPRQPNRMIPISARLLLIEDEIPSERVSTPTETGAPTGSRNCVERSR